jgi:putative heme-binding domain-containing protein
VLGRRTDSARDLLARLRQGRLPDEDLGAVLEAVRADRDPQVQRALAELTASRTGERQLTTAELDALSSRTGDADRGRALFFDRQRAGCGGCHEIEGTGGHVGPSLTRVYETLSFPQLVDSIVEPSKEIKEAFQTYETELRDGRTVAGLLLGQSPDEIVLRDATGQEVRLARKEVKQLARSNLSLMPEGLSAALTTQQFADLLAFLRSRQAQEKLRATAR